MHAKLLRGQPLPIMYSKTTPIMQQGVDFHEYFHSICPPESNWRHNFRPSSLLKEEPQISIERQLARWAMFKHDLYS